ncbi:MAG: YggS family pyridoxal phosphate-dependent enzyme [Bacteroidales bacterium]|jgi:pyridoxal phosphate enzyme (YggS family)|nr:YggS family pyridoxal phosphate-dependent enzyme [Bacteroidales bacterium]
MSIIIENIKRLQDNIPENVKLIAVSKFKSVSVIKEAYLAGQHAFGENKAQEMTDKYQSLPKDIQWHFIGHLQTNKIKYIIPYVTMIHSVDSIKLLCEINSCAEKNNRIVDCLIQFHIATEESKFGFSFYEAEKMIESNVFQLWRNIRICGVMGMATFTDDQALIRSEFKTLKAYFLTLKNKYFMDQNSFKEISMGMTDDYLIAIEEGSTMVRIGSAIFGSRTPNQNIEQNKTH